MLKLELSEKEYTSSNKVPQLQAKYQLGKTTKSNLMEELRKAQNGNSDLSPLELIDAIEVKSNALCSLKDELFQEKNRNRKQTLVDMDEDLFEDALEETENAKYGNARRLMGILETGRDMQNSLETRTGQIESFIGKYPRPNNPDRLAFVCLYKNNGRFCN